MYLFLNLIFIKLSFFLGVLFFFRKPKFFFSVFRKCQNVKKALNATKAQEHESGKQQQTAAPNAAGQQHDKKKTQANANNHEENKPQKPNAKNEEHNAAPNENARATAPPQTAKATKKAQQTNQNNHDNEQQHAPQPTPPSRRFWSFWLP